MAENIEDFERTEAERVEEGELPTPPVLYKGDPSGEHDIFLASGVMPFEADSTSIYWYVETKAREIGTKIKRNRGKPGNAREENMLSLEEKAIVILGRAIGVTWKEIKRRITAERVLKGEIPFDRDNGSLHNGVVTPHKDVVSAIQADMLDAIEVFSPLVGGSSRIIWRAKMVEFYRQRILTVARKSRIKAKEKEFRIIALDKAMASHLRFFDSMMRDEDISRILGSPSELVHAKSLEAAESAIHRRFAEGEITDEERIELLRELRHGGSG